MDPPILFENCVDNGGFYDSDGPVYNCLWYGVGSRCAQYGASYANGGAVANTMCCACGGGSPRVVSPVNPTNDPTSSPSKSPTSSPINPTNDPTSSPSKSPSASPINPTNSPTSSPSKSPTSSPIIITNPAPPAPSDPTTSPSKSSTGGDLTAAYDAGLGAPSCSDVGSSCTSGDLLDGTRGNREPNSSNTIDSCND